MVAAVVVVVDVVEMVWWRRLFIAAVEIIRMSLITTIHFGDEAYLICRTASVQSSPSSWLQDYLGFKVLFEAFLGFVSNFDRQLLNKFRILLKRR